MELRRQVTCQRAADREESLGRDTLEDGRRQYSRALPRAGVDALSLPKSAADAFWRGAVRTLSARAAVGGVERLWLDGQVARSLDHSAAQIGAPAAWQAGFTGAGVTVAVLDSGYDAAHPALAGAVTAAKGFTYAGPDDVSDRLGHGTHVAAIVASRDATYRGIAPGAKLVAGKVLEDSGFGQQSWIIAGMEWATVEQHADVVNLSLGAGDTQAGCGGFVRHRLLASSDTAGHVSVPRMLVCVDTASAPDGCQVVRCFVAWARR